MKKKIIKIMAKAAAVTFGAAVMLGISSIATDMMIGWRGSLCGCDNI